MWRCRPIDPRVANVKHFDAFNLLHAEVQDLKIKLYDHSKYRWAHRFCSADNLQGTFFGIVLDALQAKLTMASVHYAQREYKWNILCIADSRFYPEGKHGDGAAQFEAIAEDLCPGIGLRWEWTPFEFGFHHKKTGELLTEVRVPAEYTVQAVVESEQVSEDSYFEGDAEFEPDYETVKQEFERTRFLVNGRIVDWYTFENHAEPRMEILSKNTCRDTWGHLAYSVVKAACDASGDAARDPNGCVVHERENRNFLARWFKDPHLKCFRSFCNKAYADNVPAGAYNLWKTFAVDKIENWDELEGRRLVIKYIKFTHDLFGQDRAQTVFGLKWQAHPIQHPGEKPCVMACLLGQQGCGKSLWLDVPSYLMGRENAYMTTNPDQNVYSKNGTTCIVGVKYINIQEVDADKIKPFISGLCPLVTDPTVEVKGMGLNPINVESLHMIALSSNFLNAMTVDSDDERRFWIPHAVAWTADMSAEERNAFFGEFAGELKSDCFLAELKRFYLKLDVPTRFDGKSDVPIGKLQKTSRAANVDWLNDFLRTLIDDKSEQATEDGYVPGPVFQDGWLTFSNSDLHTRLQQYSRERGWKDHASATSLGTKLAFFKVRHPTALQSGRTAEDR